MTNPMGLLPSQREPDRIQAPATREPGRAASRGTAEPLLVMERRGGKFQQGDGGSNFFKPGGTIDIEAYLGSKSNLTPAQRDALKGQLETANQVLQKLASVADQSQVKSFAVQIENGQVLISFELLGSTSDKNEKPLEFTPEQALKNMASGKNNGNASKLFGSLYSALLLVQDGVSVGVKMFAESVEEQSKSIDESIRLRDKNIEKKQAENKQLEAHLKNQINITPYEAELLAQSQQEVA